MSSDADTRLQRTAQSTMSAPAYDRHGIQVHAGDCLDVLRHLPDASVHAIVTDPPAGIRFMDRAWDSDMGGRHSWVAWLSERMQEARRVLKPGGYGLVWALPRTSHWTAWALEDAGFEIRDCVVHLFGNGFPKSLDVSKAIDKARDDKPEARAVGAWLRSRREAAGLSHAEVCAHGGWHGAVNHGGASVNWEKGHNVPTWEQWLKLQELLGFDGDMNAEVWRLNGRKGAPGEAWGQREVTGQGFRVRRESTVQIAGVSGGAFAVTTAATAAAQQWEGWGTALKPAAEHWWLIRKPLAAGTVAANVQEHSAGALNVAATQAAGGRWPANAVLTAAAPGQAGCPAAELDRDSGGTSRGLPTFRWEPKAPPSERPMVGGKSHETVKPIALMRWMVRLVCAPGGTVLDCFAGSGTTGQAARAEGMRAVLIEADPDHIDKIRARLDAHPKTTTATADVGGEPLDLLDLLLGDTS
jgi:DNA methylase